MNIIFNKYIFAYLCLFYSSISIFMNFKVFLLIFALPIFLSKYPSIFIDIFYISIKFKYRYFIPIPCFYLIQISGYSLNHAYICFLILLISFKHFKQIKSKSNYTHT